MRLSPSYLALAGCAVVGGYLLIGGDEAPAQPERAAPPRSAAIPALSPRLQSVDGAPEPEAEIDEEIEEEEMRGLAPLEDLAEFAFVFSLDGESYVRLSSEERALARGTARLIEEDGVYAVVAPVTTAALPAELRAWAGRTVLVDGVCRARVVGFAEVSRISGEPPEPDRDDTDEADAGEDDAPATWTIESVTDANVVLAARLDDCTGTWARSTDYSPAAVAAKLDAPELEATARKELLARSDFDPTQEAWAKEGGEGDWRDAAEVVTHVYQHPLTGERWVFAQARHPGGCGEPGFGMMAAYRASADGTVRRVADLEFGYDDIAEVVDVDGDGQPELVLGGGNSAELVDLANKHYDSISVEHRYYGCGC
ncbi:MAG TPA: hypothetical protein VNO30_17495 [Kofleriaceae bacterium]|nr:hypothetical protein [Kofleriaceae bacterium]